MSTYTCGWLVIRLIVFNIFSCCFEKKIQTKLILAIEAISATSSKFQKQNQNCTFIQSLEQYAHGTDLYMCIFLN